MSHYYLHSDDNYYWTPEGWAEFQAAKAEVAELRATNARLTAALLSLRSGFEATMRAQGRPDVLEFNKTQAIADALKFIGDALSSQPFSDLAVIREALKAFGTLTGVDVGPRRFSKLRKHYDALRDRFGGAS